MRRGSFPWSRTRGAAAGTTPCGTGSRLRSRPSPRRTQPGSRRAGGAKRLVTTCAECYSMLKYEYPKVVGPWDGLEVLHMSELIGQLVGEVKGKFTRPVAG